MLSLTTEEFTISRWSWFIKSTFLKDFERCRCVDLRALPSDRTEALRCMVLGFPLWEVVTLGREECGGGG
jgi:hypothetical protein